MSPIKKTEILQENLESLTFRRNWSPSGWSCTSAGPGLRRPERGPTGAWRAAMHTNKAHFQVSDRVHDYQERLGLHATLPDIQIAASVLLSKACVNSTYHQSSSSTTQRRESKQFSQSLVKRTQTKTTTIHSLSTKRPLWTILIFQIKKHSKLIFLLTQ